MKAEDSSAKAQLSGPELLEEGMQHHRAFRLGDAERLYQQVLQIEPDQPDALHFLGVIADQTGRAEEAAKLITKANALDPANAGNREELGNIFKFQWQHEQDIATARAAAAADPKDAEAHYRLGAVFERQGKRAEAADAYKQAIALKPDFAEAHSNLGNVLKSQGQLEDAARCYEKVIALRPDAAGVRNNLGGVFIHLGRLEDAIACYRKAIALRPDFAEAHSNLGNALKDQGKLGDAAASLQTATELRPDAAKIHFNLSAALYEQGKLEDAVAAYKRAIDLNPDLLVTHSTILLRMNYDPAYSAADISAESRRWGEIQVGLRGAEFGPYTNDRDPGRLLKVGYVSPNFQTHSVSYFFEPLLAAHHEDAVETYCYAEVDRPDETTERLKALAGRWRPTVGMSEAEMAELVCRDRIDILVDLAGHTANNRLGVFAMKPAPVQVTWLGYPGTSGLPTIDYRFTDAIADPPGESDRHSSEELVRLPHGFHCYGAPADAPEVAPLPARTSGFVSFGSFNNLAKVTPDVITTWARIIQGTPGSRILIKSRQFTDLATREGYLEAFAANGIGAERIEFIPWLASRAEHLDLYSRVDMALDTFPYNGTTTTCEGLWMGVPAITLAGNRHAGRVGASLLTHLGLGELIADTAESYVTKAVELAGDLDRLAESRLVLRPLMQASALCDREGFAREIEAAYRGMWRRWCAEA